MAINNLVITIVGLSAVALLMKSDVRHSSAMLRRNMRTIRSWLEEQGQAAGSASKQETKQVGERGGKAAGGGGKPTGE